MKTIKKLVDKYLVFALPIDLIIIILIWLSCTYFPVFEIVLNSKPDNLDIVSNIIGASISLAGFVLASLTIIVSIRSNVKAKLPENAETPLELFFSVGAYSTIVRVFAIAIIELVLCFVVSYVIWILSMNISNQTLSNFLICLIYLIAVSSIRSLFVMFLLIAMDKKPAGNNV